MKTLCTLKFKVKDFRTSIQLYSPLPPPLDVKFSVISLPFSDYSVRPKDQNGKITNGVSESKKPLTTIDDVLIALVKWLCEQVCDTETSRSSVFPFFCLYSI